MDVFLAVFDKDAFTISKQLLGGVGSYIDEHLDRRHGISLLDVERSAIFAEEAMPIPIVAAMKGLDEVIENLKMYICDAQVCDPACEFCWFCQHYENGVPKYCSKEKIVMN